MAQFIERDSWIGGIVMLRNDPLHVVLLTRRDDILRIDDPATGQDRRIVRWEAPRATDIREVDERYPSVECPQHAVEIKSGRCDTFCIDLERNILDCSGNHPEGRPLGQATATAIATHGCQPSSMIVDTAGQSVSSHDVSDSTSIEKREKELARCMNRELEALRSQVVREGSQFFDQVAEVRASTESLDRQVGDNDATAPDPGIPVEHRSEIILEHVEIDVGSDRLEVGPVESGTDLTRINSTNALSKFDTGESGRGDFPE